MDKISCIKTTFKCKDSELKSHIFNQVVNQSKLAVKMSIVMNLYLKHVFDNNIHVPDHEYELFVNGTILNQMAKLGIEKSNNKRTDNKVYKKIIKHIWTSYFSDYSIEEENTSHQALAYKIKQYQTVFSNSLFMELKKRQIQYVKSFLRRLYLSEEDVSHLKTKFDTKYTPLKHSLYNLNFILGLINRTSTRTMKPTVLTEEETKFVELNHSMLPIHVPNIDSYLDTCFSDYLRGKKETEENIAKALEYIVNLEYSLGQINENYAKCNKLTVLKYFYEILKFIDLDPFARKFTLAPVYSVKRHHMTIDIEELRAMLQYLKLPALNDNLINVANNKKAIKTIKQKVFDDYFTIKKRHNKEFNSMIMTDGIAMTLMYNTGETKVKKSKPKKPKTIGYDKVYGLDPGRTNLFCASDSTNKIQFTNKKYYCDSGFVKRNNKTKKWESEIENNVYTLKTLNTGMIRSYIFNYINTADKVWKLRTEPKRAREQFRVFCNNKRTLDRMCNMISNQRDKNIVIAYGSASFVSSSRSEIAAPTSSIYKKMSQRFRTILTDEFNTSRICNKCKCELRNVKDQNNNIIRDFKYCESNICLESRFVDRDLNAAKNILECFLDGENRKEVFGRKHKNKNLVALNLVDLKSRAVPRN